MSKNDYSKLPENVRPISPWRYFGLSILYAIPILGFVVLVINSLSHSNNINVRNFSRSFFCGLVLVLIVVGIIMAITFAGGGIAAIKDWVADSLNS